MLDAAAEDGFAYPAVNVTFIQVRPGCLTGVDARRSSGIPVRMKTV